MFLNNFKELILNNTSASFIKFFYGLTHIQIQNIRFENNQLQIDACSKYKSAHCNCCGKKSYTKRGSYTRKITELPLAEYRVVINIRVYKYQCKNSKCTKKIFSQQIKNFTYRYGRRSLKANEYIKKICLEISAQKASYFSKILKIPLSSSTCLRLVRNMPINVSDNLSCIGIDDWAKRKGMTYGSIIVDSITRQTIDLIDSRSKSDVANWLKTHPSISLVTRDRSRTYASAITKALPKAKQIADKFHIVKNLSEAIYEELKCLFKEIKYVYNRMIRIESRENTICKIVSDEQIYKTTREARKNKYKQYKQLYDSGLKISEIARKTGSHRQTVSRYLHNGIPSIINKNRLNYDSYLTEIHAMIKKELAS